MELFHREFLLYGDIPSTSEVGERERVVGEKAVWGDRTELVALVFDEVLVTGVRAEDGLHAADGGNDGFGCDIDAGNLTGPRTLQNSRPKSANVQQVLIQ